MARGLSKQQKIILQVIDNMDNGGGPLPNVNGEILIKFYPEFWEKHREPKLTDKPTQEILYNTFYSIKEGKENAKQRKLMNKYRVTAYKWVKSLVKRELLRKEVKTTKYYLKDKVVRTIDEVSYFITDAGKEVINQNKQPMK